MQGVVLAGEALAVTSTAWLRARATELPPELTSVSWELKKAI
jgi:hypothetical protein